MSAVAQPSGLARIAHVIAIMLVFVVLGPPIGGIVFMLTAALIGFGSGADVAGLSWVALFAVIYAAPLSYLAGTVPAAVAGLMIGIRQAFFGRASLLYAVGTGVVIGLGMLFLSGQRIAGEANASVLVILLTCLVPTLLCWLVVRGWYVARELAGQRA